VIAPVMRKQREARPGPPLVALTLPVLGIAYIVFTTWTIDRFSFSVGHGVTSLKLTAAVVAILFVLGLRDPHRLLPYFRSPAALGVIVLLLLLAYAVASSVIGTGGSSSYLASNIALLVLIVVVVRRRRDVDTLVLAAGVGALAIALAAWIQVVVRVGIPTDGATAFYANHIQPALLAWVGVPLLWVFLRRDDGSIRRVVAVAMLILAGAVVLSLARGPIIVACMTGSYLFLRSRGRTASSRDRIVAGAVAFVPLLAAAGVAAWRYWTQGAEGLNAFLQGRLYLLDAGWSMFLDRPVFGHGSDQFRMLWSEYLTHFQVGAETAAKDIPAHAAYLSTAAELGGVGLALYLTLLLLLFVAVRRQQRYFSASGMSHEARLSFALEVAILAFAIHGVLDNSGWKDRAFVLLVGLVMGLEQHRREYDARGMLEVDGYEIPRTAVVPTRRFVAH
jgi:O-antigen ligase